MTINYWQTVTDDLVSVKIRVDVRLILDPTGEEPPLTGVVRVSALVTILGPDPMDERLDSIARRLAREWQSPRIDMEPWDDILAEGPPSPHDAFVWVLTPESGFVNPDPTFYLPESEDFFRLAAATEAHIEMVEDTPTD